MKTCVVAKGAALPLAVPALAALLPRPAAAPPGTAWALRSRTERCRPEPASSFKTKELSAGALLAGQGEVTQLRAEIERMRRPVETIAEELEMSGHEPEGWRARRALDGRPVAKLTVLILANVC